MLKKLILGGLTLCATLFTTGCTMMSGCGAQDATAFSLDSVPLAQSEEMGMTNSTYAWVRPSGAVTYCITFPCPSYTLRGVNGDMSQPVEYFDLRVLGFPEKQQQDMYQNMGKLLLRGRYLTVDTGRYKAQVFQVTKAYQSLSGDYKEQVLQDKYYSTKGIEEPCTHGMCSLLQATLLGKTTKETWKGVDLKDLHLSATQEEQLQKDLKAGLAHVGVARVTEDKIAQATQAFRQLTVTSK